MTDTILITGGNGNLGRLVASQLEDLGARVVSFDLPGSEGPHSAPRHAVVQGDIRDTDLLSATLETHKPDAIIHLASLLSGSSEANPQAAWDINASASVALMQMARERMEGPFLFSSSVATYGPGLPSPLAVDAPQWPETIYGATKVAVERMGHYLRRVHGFDFRCLRFPMVLSPFAPPAAMTAYPSHAFRAAVEGRPFTFPVHPETGMSNLFLDDVVASIVQLTRADGTRLKTPGYNLHAYSLTADEIAKELKARIQGFTCDFDPNPTVVGFVGGGPDEMDSTPAREEWDWAPRYDFKASAATLLERLAGESD
ncbi:MAG: NAD-dependent epimerase/dehydratase family protein [Pseudomonadota bacterium]